ncbi:MAG: filamentous hemagglutinin N-terminal domain-containing protein [Nostoc sp.]|uniref:two-partner secretion domain-containing protein n=1 Tax=Nostoc sp. TaxID=1180 RepID=UPI002FFAF6CA
MGEAPPSVIAPDNTLGAENSKVVTNFNLNGLPVEVITGGATRKINLFHSFREFNVSKGRSAYFLSPSADIQNILARVTGGNRSEILGRLGTFQIINGNIAASNANLFLINSNGIIFGQDASLDLQGSFAATTANAIAFGERGNFSATNPEVPQLLTINPSALFFNQINRSEIINRSRKAETLGITIPRSFYLVGGDITFDGSFAGSVGNRLELGAVAGTGTVELIGSGNQMQLAFPEGLSRGDILLKNNSLAFTTGGGAISVNGRNISLYGNSFISSTLQAGEGTIGVFGEDVVVNATGNLTLDNISDVTSRGLENSLGSTGNIAINAQSIRLKNQSLIDSNGPRDRGNIILNVKDDVSLDNSVITTSGIFNPVGRSGDITIASRNINLSNQSFINSDNIGIGEGGKITLKAQEYISLNNGSHISSSSSASTFGRVNSQPSGDIEIKTINLILDGNNTILSSSNLDQGRGGNIRVVADDSIFLNGLASISSSSTGQRDSGNIELKTRSLTLSNGGKIGTEASGRGNSGNLLVNASDFVNLSGITTFTNPLTEKLDFIGSGLTTSAFGAGNGEQLTINTRKLSINDGGYITTTSNQSGRGGNLIINAKDSVEVVGRSPNLASRVATSTLGSGDAGDMKVNTPQLLVRDGAEVLSNARGTGNAGMMTINASRIRLDNQASLNTNTRSPNKDPNREQATINLNTQNLNLRRNSKITANATGENVIGGNINIDTDLLIALENSRISANSDNSRGGRVRINAQGVFVGTQSSDVSKYITARSGVGLSGTVNVNSPDNSVIQNNLIELPTNAINTNALIANSCIARANRKQENSFIITGGGALPNRPGDVSMSNYSTDRVRGVNNENTSRPWKKGDAIVEPTGVYRLSNGQLVMSRECQNN